MPESFGGYDATARDVLVVLKRQLSGLLGTYKLENGTTTVAASLVGAKAVSPTWKVTGIELTVQDTPEVQQTAKGAGRGCVIATKTWNARLVNYSPATTLEAIQRRLLQLYPTVELSYQYRSEDLNIYEQLTLRLEEIVLLPLVRA